MRRTLLFLLLFVALPVGLTLLLLGGPGNFAGRAVDGDGAARTEVGRDASGAAMDDAAATGTPAHRPTLIGRPRAERVGRGGVRGRVSLAVDDTPLARARLTLEGVGYGGEEVLALATTGERGAFVISEVPAGEDYVLHVVAADAPERSRGAVAVRDGVTTDLGTLWVGEPTTLAGIVVDPSGAPVPGAHVAVHEGHFSYGRMMQDVGGMVAQLDRDPTPRATARADRAGAFEVDALPPGPVTLVARAAGYANGYLEAVVVDAEKAPARWEIRLAPAGVIAGHVVDGTGRPVVGARVAALPQSDPYPMLYGRSYVESDAEGAFRIASVPGAANLQVLVAAAGHPLTMSQASPGDEDLRIVLPVPATAIVRIVAAPDDRPLEGADVVLMLAREEDGAMDMAVGRTDVTGSVELPLRPGAVQVAFVTHPDHPPGVWNPMMPGPAFLEGPEDPTLQAGRNTLRFRFGESVRVRGRVLDEAGQAIAGAEVSAFGGSTFGRPATSGEDGAFALAAASGFAAILLVRAPGYVPAQESFRLEEGAVEVEHDVTLARSAVVTGRVVDEEGRPVTGAQVKVAPASGGVAMGMFAEAIQAPPAITGASGRYVLADVAPAEEVRVLARRPGLVTGSSEPFPVEGGGGVRAPDVVLKAGWTLLVDVLDPDGGAAVGAVVDVHVARQDAMVWSEMERLGGERGAEAGASGRARIDRVAAGTVTLTATLAPWASSSRTVTLDAETESPLRVAIPLRRARALSGRVTDEGGVGIGGAVVTVHDAEGAWTHAVAEADGTFRLEGVPVTATEAAVSATGFRLRTVALSDPSALLPVRLERLDLSDPQARRVALSQAIARTVEHLRDAKSSAERRAIQAEMARLTEEWQALQAEGG